MNLKPTYLLLSILVSSTVTQASSLLASRSIFDPYIICNDPFAVPRPPTGYQTFANYLTLCAAVRGKQRSNMGCYCDRPYGLVHCDESRGDPQLWSATTILINADTGQRSWATLFDLCLHVCHCSSAAKGRAARNETGRFRTTQETSSSETSTTSEGGYNADSDHAPGSSSGGSLGSSSSDLPASSSNNLPESSSSNSSDELAANMPHSPLSSPYQATCASNCSTNAECQGSKGDCICRTQKETYVMGKGIVHFVAACMISLGGKRAEDTPCPCNTTYVSQACCGAENGLVWEDETFKLGELLPRDEM